jgi:multimeric flavodoxin WrbA
MDIKILGISGSARKGRNTEFFIKKVFEGAQEMGHTESLPGDIETDMISLAAYNIQPCTACVKCDKVGEEEERYCPTIKDDLPIVIDKMLWADAIVLGVPVYVGDVTAQMKILMDRCEVVGSGSKRLKLKVGLRNKVGGAVVQGTLRHGGQEFAAATIHRFFIFKGMIPVGAMEGHSAAGPWGGMGVGYPYGSAISKGNALEKDELGIKACRDLGRRLALVTKMIKPYAAREREEFIEWHNKNIAKQDL